MFDAPPEITQAAPGQWTLASTPLPTNTETGWLAGQGVFVLLDTGAVDNQTGTSLAQLYGTVAESNGVFSADWTSYAGPTAPTITDQGVYSQFTGASLTSHAFERAQPGLGRWLVTLASWLFAISTMISWSYYGEQGVVFMFGAKWVRTYKVIYCLLIIVATSGLVSTDRELDNLTTIGTGVMLFANIPIILIFGRQAMEKYHEYVARLRAGEIKRTS